MIIIIAHVLALFQDFIRYKMEKVNHSGLSNAEAAGKTNVMVVSDLRRALPQFMVVAVKNLILLGWGFILGYPTILIPALQNETDPAFTLTSEEISWISSINLLCVPLGSVISGLLSDPLGKRRVMQILNLPMMVAWALFYFATDIRYIYAALCLSGMSGGLLEAPLLTYIAETVQPQYRGMLTATGTATVIGGVCLQFIIGSFVQWRLVAALSAIIPFLGFIAVFFVPESPYWLYGKKRVEDAHKSLQWLRGWVSFATVENEFSEIAFSVERERSERKAMKHAPQKNCCSRIVPFTKQSFIAPFLLIVSAFFIGHFSGMTPLQTYAIHIFSSFNVPINEYYATIMLGTAQFLGCVIGAVCIRSTGKRPLVFASLIGCGLCFFITATYSHINGIGITSSAIGATNHNINNHLAINFTNNDTDTHRTYSRSIDETPENTGAQWMPLFFLLGGSMFAHMGIKCVPWMLIGEVYPTMVRGTAAGLSSALGYLIGFLSNKLFLSTEAAFTLPGTFWFYSGVTAIGCVLLYFVLPETENKSLLEIEAYFDKSKKVYLREKRKLEGENGMQKTEVIVSS